MLSGSRNVCLAQKGPTVFQPQPSPYGGSFLQNTSPSPAFASTCNAMLAARQKATSGPARKGVDVQVLSLKLSGCAMAVPYQKNLAFDLSSFTGRSLLESLEFVFHVSVLAFLKWNSLYNQNIS